MSINPLKAVKGFLAVQEAGIEHQLFKVDPEGGCAGVRERSYHHRSLPGKKLLYSLITHHGMESGYHIG